MSRLKMLKNGLFFVDYSSSCRRETIHFTFVYLIFSSYCSLAARSQDVQQRERENCVFDIKKEGHRLDAMVYKYINVLFPMDCAAHCFREFCCRSANFRKIPVKNGRENCELLHALAEEEPEKLKRNNIYDYLVVGRGEPFNCICSSCKNDGDCSSTSKKCSCSPGFNGTRCENALCGATFNSLTGSFTSPNYPNNYENYQVCFWLIKLASNCKIQLTFEEFILENNCAYDKVEIFDGGSMDATKQTFCGTNSPGVFMSSTNTVFVTFHSDHSKIYKGFKADWSAAQCSS